MKFLVIFALFIGFLESAKSDEIPIIREYDPCLANTHFARDGAECICDSLSVEICETRAEQIKRINCKLGTVFNDGCNTCHCTETLGICTLMACFRQPQYCEIGKTYKIGVKSWVCDDGRKFKCQNCV
jgi:hypothetical protein